MISADPLHATLHCRFGNVSAKITGAHFGEGLSNKEGLMELKGKYIPGDGTVKKIWESLSEGHSHEFPKIKECCPGTFNVCIENLPNEMPPDDEKYRTLGGGTYISSRVRVVKMNGKEVIAWLYRGGHEGKPIWELLSEKNLKELLGVEHGADITLTIEICEEGTEGMPQIRI